MFPYLKPVVGGLLCLALSLYGPRLSALQAGAKPSPVTPIARVHDLPPSTAAQHRPVHLVGTVTYYESTGANLFIADSSGGIYISPPYSSALQEGDLVDVEGYTAPSFRTVVAPGANLRWLGHTPLGASKLPGLQSFNELMTGSLDCRYVTVRGHVRSALLKTSGASHYLEVELLMPGGLVHSYVKRPGSLDPRELIDAEVEISGAVGGEFNGQWVLLRALLYSADIAELKILHKPTLRPGELPVTSLSQVMGTRSVIDQTPRVRVQGTVTDYQPGHFLVIQNGEGGLYAATRQTTPIPLGSAVDLVGFAEEGSYGPRLGQAEILQIRPSIPVTPVPVTFAQAISGEYSDELVTVEGTVLAQLEADEMENLTLLVDGHPVSVVLPLSEPHRPLARLPLGTRVSTKGVCRVGAIGNWGKTGPKATAFRINMRADSDLHVLSWPSWWNLTHVLYLCGLFCSLLVLIALWAMVLRSKVARQTARIASNMRLEQERSRLLEAINTEQPLEELLDDICRTFATLGADLVFGCALFSRSDDGRDAPPTFSGSEVVDLALELFLVDPAGHRVGAFRIGQTRGLPLGENDVDISHTAAGLANLAINQRRLYAELNYTSAHDQLTGLPNRRTADLALETALQTAGASRLVGVFYIDIDRFKQVNDQHGHKIGDLYLQQIASRLTGVMAPEDTLARIGGDEFLLIAVSASNEAELESYQGRLHSCFVESFLLDGIAVEGSASVGVAVSPDHGRSPEALKRHADSNMYAAKHLRRSTDGEADTANASAEIFTPKELREALEQERFTLHYQPQFSSTGDFRGLEALLRLQDPVLGLVFPDAFIAVAERDPLMSPLGHWVLRRALADSVAWGLEHLPDVRMIVNVSARELDHPDFAEGVLQALQEFHLAPDRLELEITERAAMGESTLARTQLRTLCAKGVHIAIDDFGTEYSCLSRLHTLPIDTLKLDRSFVLAWNRDPAVLHLIEAVVNLAHTLEKRIVMEGVETAEDVARLAQMGDVDLQGYFFSKPKPAHLVASNLEGWRSGFRRSPSHAFAGQAIPDVATPDQLLTAQLLTDQPRSGRRMLTVN